MRAGAERVVEREEPRLDLRDGEARHRAGELRGEDQLLGQALRRRVGELDERDAVGEVERRLETLGEARRHVGPHRDAVHHDADVVLQLLVEDRRLVDRVELAVDLEALEPLALVFGDLLAVLALAAPHHRRDEVEARVGRQRQHAVDHLADGLALDRQAGGGRIGDADPRPQQAHVIVDLRHGADGRARVLRCRLLLDRDGGRQAVDLVDVRLAHHLEELAGVGGERFDVAALALGIDRVEGERRLARARQAGEDHQLVARDRQVDVLEIVLARAPHHDGVAVGQAGPVGLEDAGQRLVRDRVGAIGGRRHGLHGSHLAHDAGRLGGRLGRTGGDLGFAASWGGADAPWRDGFPVDLPAGHRPGRAFI